MFLLDLCKNSFSGKCGVWNSINKYVSCVQLGCMKLINNVCLLYVTTVYKIQSIDASVVCKYIVWSSINKCVSVMYNGV